MEKIPTEQLKELKQIDAELMVNDNQEPLLFCSPLKLTEITTKLKKENINYKVLGSPNALVCMFEFFKGDMGWPEKTSKGLARITPVQQNTLHVDASVSGLSPGVYSVGLHEYGDLSRGIKSAGDVIVSLQDINVDNDGKANLNQSIKGEIWEWVGKSLCLQSDKESICGIVARSAGVFENKKRVCSCTGKTIWEE